MAEMELTIQGLSSVFFFGIGVYFLVSKRLKSTSLFGIVKVSGWFLVALGILLALLMIVLPQPRAWQTGKAVLLAAATISNFFSGVYNLAYRRKVSIDKGTGEVAKIVGILLLILAAWTGILFCFFARAIGSSLICLISHTLYGL